jgi:hypothetical protein
MSIACSGTLGNAPHALTAWLLEQNYPECNRTAIVAHVEREGTLAGLVDRQLLDPEDEATATEVFVEALPAVPQTDPAWCDGGMEYTLPDAELEAIDAPSTGEARWLALMWSGMPPRHQISDDELGMLAGGLPLG